MAAVSAAVRSVSEAAAAGGGVLWGYSTGVIFAGEGNNVEHVSFGSRGAIGAVLGHAAGPRGAPAGPKPAAARTACNKRPRGCELLRQRHQRARRLVWHATPRRRRRRRRRHRRRPATPTGMWHGVHCCAAVRCDKTAIGPGQASALAAGAPAGAPGGERCGSGVLAAVLRQQRCSIAAAVSPPIYA